MLKTISEWKSEIRGGALSAQFGRLYSACDIAAARYTAALESFESRFGDKAAGIFSAPGRAELAGNHTDHQRGCVLAAAVNMDILAVAAPREDSRVFVCSEGYGDDETDIADLSVNKNEAGSSKALIRGIASAMTQRGAALAGFDAYISSEVPQGAGLSSSAAYEVLVGKIFSELFCAGRFFAQELAIMGQYAENEYFGKPSGLMDQMASAVGGIVFIDFADPAGPVAERVSADLEKSGYCLCITDSGGSHACLTGEYAEITREMGAVAKFFGKKYLREVDERLFFESLPDLRKKTSDRAILRAMHFFGENGRVRLQLGALTGADMAKYLTLMDASGRSSAALLQNICPASDKTERSLALALAISQSVLNGEGASRVHGGGFAGTVQALVPCSRAQEYKREMDRVFGKNACHILKVRPLGAYAME